MRTTWPVGACFACPRCRGRGLTPVCRDCGGETVDLREPGALERLAWPGLEPHRRGLSLLSPRAIPHQRSLIVVAVLLAVPNSLAPILGPLLDGREQSVADVAAGAVCGLLSIPLLVGFYALFLFGVAHVCRVLSVLVGLSPLRTAGVRLVTWLLSLPARWWLPQLEACHTPDVPGGTKGELTAPLALEVVRDSLSYLERFDAWLVTPLQVRTPEGDAVFELEHGTVSYRPSAEVEDGSGPPPAWATAPHRPGVRMRRTFPAGTRVEIARRDGLVHVVLGG